MSLSFYEYMGRCLYDPEHGYYASGAVTFGKGHHFWTYPQRLQPLFGWMVAEAARTLFLSLLESGRVPDDAPLTLLELGAGNGDLARDALQYIVEHEQSEEWAPLRGRIRYVIGEISAALRVRQGEKLQEFIDTGRAEVREVDARDLSWDGPFYGVLVANELIDAFPCELLEITTPEQVARTYVQATRGEADLDGEALWSALKEGVSGDALDLREVTEPLERWPGGVPSTLTEYLRTLAPLIRDLDTCGLLPVELCWAPDLPGFVANVARLLTHDGGLGVALFVDYGGSSRHVLDPRAAAPHLRVYGPDGARAHTRTVLRDPGAYDLTWDVDFSELARLAAAAGLSVPFFGHQAALEAPPIDLWSRAAQRLLILGRAREGIENNFQATLEAHELVQRFRQAAGFRMMALTHPDVAFPAARFGLADQYIGDGLRTLKQHIPQEALVAALEAAGIDDALAEHLKPCGDPIADASDHRLYAKRQALMELLAANGWLAQAGEL